MTDAALLIPRLDDDPESDWRDEALCAQIDPEAWFPGKGEPAKDAKRVCRSCPVRLECLEYALEHDERFGVWGGLTERERRRARRNGQDAFQIIDAEQPPRQGAAVSEQATAEEPGHPAAVVLALAPPPSPETLPPQEQALTETCQREDTTLMQKAEAMELLISQHGYTAAIIAGRTGLPVRTITSCLTLLDLDPATRRRVHDGLITATTAIAAVLQVRKQTPMQRVRETSRGSGNRAVHHPLSGLARARCDGLGHPGRDRVDGTACSSCWEEVIRVDERAAAGRPLRAVPMPRTRQAS